MRETTALDAEAMTRARALLSKPERPERLWPVLAAAGLFAFCALSFATAMVLAPPLVRQHVVEDFG